VTPYFISPLIGGAAAVVFTWLLGLRRPQVTAMGLVSGLLAFLISVIIQGPIQQLPILIALAPRLTGITSPGELQQLIREFIEGIGVAGVLGLSLWLGFTAGAVQTGFKYLFISPILKKSYRGALSVGLAFGFTETVYIATLTLLVATGIPETPSWMIPVSATASAFERFSATIFHTGTSPYIADTARRGVGLRGALTVVVLHGSMDTAAALYQLTQAYNVLNASIALALGGVAVVVGLLAGLLLTMKLRRRVLEEA